MSVLFILSFILFICSFLSIKKTQNKLNILLWIFISVIIYMGYNSIIVYLLSQLNIHSTLFLRSLINIIISIIMIIASKKKQKYYIDIKDIAVIVMLLCLSLIIFKQRFTFNFSINFVMNDAAAHFSFAKAFMANDIYDSSMHNIYYAISTRGMFFGSINAGTFMELFKPLTGDFYLFKNFIIFEMLSYTLSGILFYFIVKKNNTLNKKYVLTVILTLLYQMGYPLTNLIYGFHYWGLVILIISTIILTIKEMENNNMYKNKLIILILFIQSLSIFITYYLYVPVIYGALGLYFIYLYKYKKEISWKKSIIYIIIILLIPFIFGMYHYGIIEQYFKNFGPKTSMSIEGSNYKNLIGNFIFLLPILFYAILNEIKRKKINLVTIITCLNIIFMIILFILCMTKIMSSYYYNKIYNLLWLNTFIYLTDIIYNYKEKFIKIYLYSYIIIALLACFRIENIISKYNPKISQDTVISNIGNVYDCNINMLQDRSKILDNNSYELLKHVKKHEEEYKNTRGEIPFIAGYFKKIWITQLLDVIVSNNYKKKTKKTEIDRYFLDNISEVETDDTVKYFVWIPNAKNSKDINIDDYIVIYKNKEGYVLKKK